MVIVTFLLPSQVHWEVSSPIGSLGSRDLTATSGTLMFYPRDDIGKNIIIGIKGDDIPELEAVYVVKITSVDGGGDVEMSALNVTFKIRYVWNLFCLRCK